MAKQVKVKILEMEQGEFDVYNMTSEEPKFMISVFIHIRFEKDG